VSGETREYEWFAEAKRIAKEEGRDLPVLASYMDPNPDKFMQWTVEPCAREHTPGMVCILQNGHEEDRMSTDALGYLMAALWPGKYDNRTRTWDWCGCVAPASEHFARGFCPLLRILAAHDEAVRVSERVRLAGAGTSESARICQTCHQPDPEWLNSLGSVVTGEAGGRLTAIREAHAPVTFEFPTEQTYCPSSDVPTDQCHTCIVLAELLAAPAASETREEAK
jgi:hypothetical protein